MSFRYDLSPCKPYRTTYSRSLQNKLKICAVSPHANPKTCARRERPRVVPFIYHSANLVEGQVPTADECRRALFNYAGAPTARPVGKIGMLVVPYKISLKSVPYQLTQTSNPAPVGNDPVSFRYDLSPCKPYGTTYSRSLQNKLKICAVSTHTKPKNTQKKEPPGKTGGSSYAGIALCSSRDT